MLGYAFCITCGTPIRPFDSDRCGRCELEARGSAGARVRVKRAAKPNRPREIPA